ncbi:MAG: hypothetical protein ACXACB_14010 [Promethearchaeota archaeon]
MKNLRDLRNLLGMLILIFGLFSTNPKLTTHIEIIASNANQNMNIQTLWNNTYGKQSIDRVYSGLQNTEGDFLFVGETWSFGNGNNDFWTIKVNNLGISQWNKTYGGSGVDYARSIVQTLDRGYLIVGDIDSNMCLVKIDSTGDTKWNTTFGVIGNGIARYITRTFDDNYVIVGSSFSGDPIWGDMVLIKINSTGWVLTTNLFGGGAKDIAHSVVATVDGGVLIAGSTQSYGAGNSDIWLVKTDVEGELQWSKTYGGPDIEAALSVIHTSDGGFLLGGVSSSYGFGPSDMWVVKVDQKGLLEWNCTYGNENQEHVTSMIQTIDGGYLLVGITQTNSAAPSDSLLVKINSKGHEEWNETFGGVGDDEIHHILQSSTENFLLIGTTDSFGEGNSDAWILRLEIPISEKFSLWEVITPLLLFSAFLGLVIVMRIRIKKTNKTLDD